MQVSKQSSKQGRKFSPAFCHIGIAKGMHHTKFLMKLFQVDTHFIVRQALYSSLNTKVTHSICQPLSYNLCIYYIDIYIYKT